MSSPYLVYVVCMLDRDGKPRGVEKVAGEAFHLQPGAAKTALEKLALPGFAVCEATLEIGKPLAEPIAA